MHIYPDVATTTENTMTDPDAIAAFMLAGHAYFTLTSHKTGEHLTYHIDDFVKPDGSRIHFVKVLSGQDGNNYVFLGTIFDGRSYRPSRKSPFGPETASQKAIRWLVEQVLIRRQLPTGVTFQHSGVCGRCGRQLTHPDSISTGLGPECARLVT